MFARKKIDRLDTTEDPAFRARLEDAAASEKKKDAMLKDAHLIEAAREQGMRIVALDDVVRQNFQEVARSLAALRDVCWINPDKPDEDPLEWLQAGAPADDFRKLGHATEVSF